ncbi:SDR family NAD(P)-dependent oxidoreductase [Streptomyces sp. NPDC051286]|uniref:SDR family NAD(P)-dependent oxidoreductase n=1 Tax=Streptomyces sp. NPDC051286 TaxID=3365647 RepID=UPI0037B91283
MTPTGDSRFDGYGVLITGAGQGIGAATARRLASEGARVLVTDLDGDRAEHTAAAIRKTGATAEALPCDVGDRTAVEAAVARAVEAFGTLDVLVNNAYRCTPDTPFFEDEPDDVWQGDLDATLTGPYRCSRAALPHLVASGRGAIVNIGSVNGEQDFGNHAYSAAKAGLGSLTRTLAGHAGPRGVRVNLVAPGTIRTDAWADRADVLDRVSPLYPLGRVGEPDDIAAAVAFLASRDAAWITGTTLRVDGGLLAVNAGFRRAIAQD